jgi:hypothetical protein
MDELFAQFLSLSSTSVLVDKLVDDARAGKPLQIPTLYVVMKFCQCLLRSTCPFTRSLDLSFVPCNARGGLTALMLCRATSHLHVTKLNPSLSPIRGRTASPPPRSPSRSPSLSGRSPEPKSPPPNVFTFGPFLGVIEVFLEPRLLSMCLFVAQMTAPSGWCTHTCWQRRQSSTACRRPKRPHPSSQNIPRCVQQQRSFKMNIPQGCVPLPLQAGSHGNRDVAVFTVFAAVYGFRALPPS